MTRDQVIKLKEQTNPSTAQTDSIHTSVEDTQCTLDVMDAIIERTFITIDTHIDKHVGDMTLMQAMEFVGIMIDIRERQQVYMDRVSPQCIKKPKR